MKTNRIYRAFFNMMLTESMSVGRYDLDENFIALTDGYRAYKILKSDCPLNFSRIRDFSDNDNEMPKFELSEEHKKLARTNELFDYRYGGKHRFARKYHCDDCDVWVDDSYVEFFENPTFYGTGETAAVMVCENNATVQGIVLPVRKR